MKQMKNKDVHRYRKAPLMSRHVILSSLAVNLHHILVITFCFSHSITLDEQRMKPFLVQNLIKIVSGKGKTDILIRVIK